MLLTHHQPAPGPNRTEDAPLQHARIALAATAFVQWSFLASLAARPPGMAALFKVPLTALTALELAGALAVTALTALLWLDPAQGLTSRVKRALTALSSHPLRPILIALCLLLAVYPLLGYYPAMWLGYPLFGLQFVLLAISLYVIKPLAAPTRSEKTAVAVAITVLAVGLGLRIWWLFADWVWIDEGIYVSLASNLLKGGGLAPETLYLPDRLPIPYWGKTLYVYGLWARCFGVGVTQLRFMSYLIGLLALPFIYGASSLWYGRRAGLVTVSLVSLTFLFLLSTVARNNALPILAASLILFTHVHACKKDSPALHFLTGLLAVLALETHVEFVSFIAAWGFYYFIDFLSRWRKKGRWPGLTPVWYYAAAVAIGLPLYYLIHVTPLQGGLSTFLDSLISSPLQPGKTTFLGARYLALEYRFSRLWHEAPFELLLFLAAAVAAAVRRTGPDRHWLTLAILLQIAYFFLDPFGYLDYLSYTVPVMFVSTGALVTRGFSREEHPASPWETVTYLGLSLLLATQAVSAIQAHNANRLHWEARRQPILTYIRDNVTPGSMIITGTDVYAAQLTGYEWIISPEHVNAGVGASLTGQSNEAFWQGVYAARWPDVYIASDWIEAETGVPPLRSYLAARRAEEVIPQVFRAQDGPLVTDAAYLSADGPGLKMVAHNRLRSPAAPGSTLELRTIWITAGTPPAAYAADLTLLDESGAVVMAESLPLVSAWAGTQTADWGSYEFHDVVFTLLLDDDLPAATYTVQLALVTTSGDETGYQIAIDRFEVAP
jgi:hypothetical protein